MGEAAISLGDARFLTVAVIFLGDPAETLLTLVVLGPGLISAAASAPFITGFVAFGEPIALMTFAGILLTCVALACY